MEHLAAVSRASWQQPRTEARILRNCYTAFSFPTFDDRTIWSPPLPQLRAVLHGHAVGIRSSAVDERGNEQRVSRSATAFVAGLVASTVAVAGSRRRGQRRSRAVVTRQRAENLRVEEPFIAAASADAQAKMSRCYVHAMGDGERLRLAALRLKIPDIVAFVRKMTNESSSAPSGPVTIWGVDVDSEGVSTDIVLLKFLRAADLDVDKAAARILDTLVFRAREGVDKLLDAELPDQFRGHDVISGTDSDGRPMLISRYGRMDNEKVFGNVDAFVRYRMQIMEQALSKLRFEPGAAEDLCQIHDYSGVPLLFKTPEVQASVSAMTKVFTEHYPETKGTTIFINFPSVFSTLFQAFARFIPERTRKKFLILGKSDHAILFQQVRPEFVPEDMGGMLVDGPRKLTGPCQVITIRGREEVEFPVKVVGSPAMVSWDMRVCRFEVYCELVFVPADGGRKKVISSWLRENGLKATTGVISGEFYADAPGKLTCRVKNNSWLQSKVFVCRAECVG
eukprot:TRINITY_DN74744_c0_g1_i1.p1 TRINITY_DN74744_c0_g1~~TRINITY_DN74744_c0_g1_i1.p1  ORF type:complete len:508 (-),score=61.79 TRINITY_DN74744_c0_g1_i1:66-1589(-)